jgi:hypothetical protein
MTIIKPLSVFGLVFFLAAVPAEPQILRNTAFSAEEIDQAVAFFKTMQIQWFGVTEDVRKIKTQLQTDSSTLDMAMTRAVLRDLSQLRTDRDDLKKTISMLEARIAELEKRH